MLIFVGLILVVLGVLYWILRKNDSKKQIEKKTLQAGISEEYWTKLLLAINELDKQENPIAEIQLLKDKCKEIELLAKAKSEKVVLMLLGEFSAGKSSFINALLEKDVLTTKIRPTTAKVTILSYAEKEKVVVHEVGGRVSIIPLDAQHKNIAQITAMDKNQENVEELKQIEYVEIFLCSEILKEMDIIDTPGFNSGYEWHTVSTRKFLQKADVILWMFHASKAGTRTEYELLKEIGSQHKLAIVNQIDRINQIDRKEVYKHICDEIPMKMFERIFFISSKKPKNGENAIDYQRIQEIRQYFAMEIVPQKRKYVFDHKKQFLQELLQIIQNAENKLDQDCSCRKSEMHSLMIKYRTLQQKIKTYTDAINYYQHYKNKIETVLQNIEKILVPEYQTAVIISAVKDLYEERVRLKQEQEQLLSLKTIEASRHKNYDDSVDKYVPLKQAYDDSFFSNIVDSVWNFIADSNFTDAKDELDKAEYEMKEAKRLWQQSHRDLKSTTQRYENDKVNFDNGCDKLMQILQKQVMIQQQSLQKCQNKAKSIKQQYEYWERDFKKRENMLKVVHNIRQVAEC